MTTEDRLNRIAEDVASLKALLKAHTDQDMTQFTKLEDLIKDVGQKVDALRLADAARAGIQMGASRKFVAGLLLWSL